MKDLQKSKFIQLLGDIPNISVQGYNKNRKVIYWNNASEELYGYSSKEALGQKLEDLIIPDFMKSDVIKFIQNWYDHNEAIPSGELSLKHKDNHFVYVYSSHVMLGEDTDSPEMFCIDIDLSSQKKQEQILFQQSRIAAVGEMIGNIAHQWRQPLSLISTASTGLKLSLELDQKIDKEKIIETLDIVNNSAQHLSVTIDDFRNFFRDDLTLVKEFNLKDTFSRVRELTFASFNHNFIIYSEEIDTVYLELNENLLIQALINLYNNSKDALLDKRYDRYFFVVVKKNMNSIVIKIKDNGGGIKPDILDKIFEPYFTTKHESVGTGIGLYMTNQLITKQMKGEISVENVKVIENGIEYDGTEFTIILKCN